jgi:nitrous oxidase accessory protein NosD
VHGNSTGICVSAGTGHRVRTSLIENNESGIGVFGVVGVEILNNTVKNSAINGLQVGSCPTGAPVTIDHNLVAGFGNQAILVTFCSPVITNNTIRGNGPGPSAGGIRLVEAGAAVLTRNVIQQVGSGLFMFGTIGATASFNTISFTVDGLTVNGSDGVTVTRNNVSRASDFDCLLLGGGGNVLTGNNCGTQFPPGAFD